MTAPVEAFKFPKPPCVGVVTIAKVREVPFASYPVRTRGIALAVLTMIS